MINYYKLFINLLLFVFIFAYSVIGGETLVPSGNDLQNAIDAAQDGDVLILEDGGVYDQSTNVTSANLAISGMNLTIKAQDGANKPVVSFAGFNIDGEANAIKIQGIKFQSKGQNTFRTSYFINFTEQFVQADFLKVIDCEADGFQRCVLRADRVASTCDSLVFDNDIFTNLDESYRLFHFGNKLDYFYFQLTNTTVANFTERIIWSNSLFSKKQVIIDNCTFDGLSATNAGVFLLDGDAGSSLKITDCLLTNFESGELFDVSSLFADTVKNTRFYNVGDTANVWNYRESFLEEDPQYADPANLDFTLPENSALRTAGTNGGPIGDPRWAGGITGIAKKTESLPDNFELRQNYPNPFNPTTHITYSLPEAGFVKLDIVNIRGQHVSTLVNDYKPAGEYNVVFDAQNLTSGLYLYRLAMKNKLQIKKMILIK